MLPRDLKADSFEAYPPGARALIASHLDSIRHLPLAFVPSLLRRLLEYDYGFPAERATIGREMDVVRSLSAAKRDEWFAGFKTITLSSELENCDWINSPAQFIERESAYLWSTHQLDAFRKAATDYGDRMAADTRTSAPSMQRLGIAIVGQGVATYDAPLFRNLRKHGTWFSNVNPNGGAAALVSELERRARTNPSSYAHWYVDGGEPLNCATDITCVSYERLNGMRVSLLNRIQAEIARPGMGPEELRSQLARLTPEDLNLKDATDPVLSRFQLRLFTEGSGTQIYSTTFAQWTAREVLRRAQAITLLVRYAPRQTQRPMNELLSGKQGEKELDPPGSLVDGEMGAYYQWIDQQRLPGAERSAFIAWFEGHGDAVVIGPAMPQGAESHSAIEMGKLLSLVSTT